MSYFNADQEAYLESLSRIPLKERCFCGWELAGKCTSPNCKPGLTCADKCLPCHGIGRRWIDGIEYDAVSMETRVKRDWATCPDCKGSGIISKGA